MIFLFKNEMINYEITGNLNGETILFLHGWGGNKNSFVSTQKLLEKNFKIITLTMPTISPTTSVWTLFDYADLVEQILLTNNIRNIALICHSFGFRVATILNKKIPIKKIIVTGGAGPKKLKKFKFIRKLNENNVKIMLNSGKFKNLFKKIASPNYFELSQVNRKTFKNIVNLNLKFALHFSCPMLLFWGKKDKETPIWIAKKLEKINHAKLILSPSNHFAYLHDNAQFNHQILKFLNE